MEKTEGGRKCAIVWDCGSPLYDSYELAELTNIVERLATVSLPVSPSRFEADPRAKDDDFFIKRLTKYDQKAKLGVYKNRFHSFCARMGLQMKK